MVISMEKKQRKDRYGEFRTAFEKNRLLVLRSQDICGICGQPVDKTLKAPHPLSPTIDHIIPLDKGGHPSDLANLQLAHRACNRAKSNKLFMMQRPADLTEQNQQINNDDLPWHFDWFDYKAT